MFEIAKDIRCCLKPGTAQQISKIRGQIKFLSEVKHSDLLHEAHVTHQLSRLQASLLQGQGRDPQEEESTVSSASFYSVSNSMGKLPDSPLKQPSSETASPLPFVSASDVKILETESKRGDVSPKKATAACKSAISKQNLSLYLQPEVISPQR